jgi:uncharacterized protein YfaT (DUF1175 family)
MLTVWFPASCPVFIVKIVKSLYMVNSNLRKVSSEFSLTFPGGLHMLYNSHIKHLMLCCELICVKHKGDHVRNVTNLLDDILEL